MKQNRFLTDRYENEGTRRDVAFYNYRLLQGLFMSATRVQLFFDKKNTYKHVSNGIKDLFSCPADDFIAERDFELSFIKFLHENQYKIDHNHPYFNVLNECSCLINYDFPGLSGELFHNTPIFDMRKYINLICDVNEKGEIVDFSKDIKKGGVEVNGKMKYQYDEKILSELQEAMQYTEKAYDSYDELTNHKEKNDSRSK